MILVTKIFEVCRVDGRNKSSVRPRFDLEKLRDPNAAYIFKATVVEKLASQSRPGHSYHYYHLQYSGD